MRSKLEQIGVACDVFDIAGQEPIFGDICDPHALAKRMEGCSGVVHLAAVSRVQWAQQDPQKCWAVNVEGTRNVLRAAMRMATGKRPWMLYASSREVYGQSRDLPVAEGCAIAPINPYGASKAACEALVLAARDAGLVGGIARFSNVYGSEHDHPDRVIPAFARAVVAGGRLLVEGAQNTFDFTHVEDVADGIISFCRLLSEAGEGPPPIHFVSGQPTTLLELAELMVSLSGSNAEIQLTKPRDFDVSAFFGKPGRAREMLGWEATTQLPTGLADLIEAFKLQLVASQNGSELQHVGRAPDVSLLARPAAELQRKRRNLTPPAPLGESRTKKLADEPIH